MWKSLLFSHKNQSLFDLPRCVTAKRGMLEGMKRNGGMLMKTCLSVAFFSISATIGHPVLLL